MNANILVEAAETFAAEVLASALRSRKKVVIKGLGTFTLMKVSKRKARNPLTGKTVVIPESTRVHFRPFPAFLERLQ